MVALAECVIGNNHKSDVNADSKHNVAPLAVPNPSPPSPIYGSTEP